MAPNEIRYPGLGVKYFFVSVALLVILVVCLKVKNQNYLELILSLPIYIVGASLLLAHFRKNRGTYRLAPEGLTVSDREGERTVRYDEIQVNKSWLEYEVVFTGKHFNLVNLGKDAQFGRQLKERTDQAFRIVASSATAE